MRKSTQLFIFFAVLGTGLRLFLSDLGFNQDMITIHTIGRMPWGTNFYEAMPYSANWGPIPYWIFQIFARLPKCTNPAVFHYYVAGFLSLCDVLTGFVLWRIWGVGVAGVFLLSPAAITIAGYHGNAEPALVAAAVTGLYLYERQRRRSDGSVVSPWLYVGIGISLAFKHAFVLLPVWLALRPISWRERARCLALSYGTWLLTWVPYLYPDPRPIFKNILLYGWWSGNSLVPHLIRGTLHGLGFGFTDEALKPLWLPIFLGSMLAVGWWVRRLEVKRIFLLYTPALVGLSSAIANQYFATPCHSLALGSGWEIWVYHLVSGWQMGGHPDELHLYKMYHYFAHYLDNYAWMFLQAVLLFALVRRIRVWRPLV